MGSYLIMLLILHNIIYMVAWLSLLIIILEFLSVIELFLLCSSANENNLRKGIVPQ